jgi:histone H3/H4
MALKFRRGTTAQKSGSLAFGEPFVNTDLNTLQIGGPSGDITLGTTGESSAFAGVSVSASSFISGAALKITGNAAIDGNLTLGGAITIGDATADTVNVVASLSSSLIPQTTNVFDLGSATKAWRDLYISTGSIKFVNPTTNTVVSTLSANADGDFTVAGKINASALEITSASSAEIRLKNSSTGIDYHIQNTAGGNFSIHNAETNQSIFRIDSGSFPQHAHFFGNLYVTQSLNVGLEVSSATGSFGVLRATNTISGSITGIGNVSAYSSSVNSRLVVVEGVSASAAGALNSVSGAFATTISTLGGDYATDAELSAVSAAVAVRDAAQDVLISSLQSNVVSASVFNTFSTSVDSRLDSVELVSASAAGALNSVSGAFATRTAGIDSTISTLSSSVDSRLDSVELVSASAASALNSVSGAFNTTISNLGNTYATDAELSSVSGAFATRVAGIDSTITSLSTSVDSRLDVVEGVSASAASALNSLSSSASSAYAKVGSANTFNGNQTISGSLIVTQDLVIGGSASIQHVTSSQLNISDNIITVNTINPTVRFGGLAIIDSGSAGISGSFLYDSVQDEFVFVHKGDGTNITSSHFLVGPETYNDLGNETYLSANKVLKSKGNEHVVESNITDNGTTITLGSNTSVTGTLVATGTSLVSASAQITLSSTTGYSTFSSSVAATDAAQDTTISTLSSSVNSRLLVVEAVSSSAASALNSFSASNAATDATQTTNITTATTAAAGAFASASAYSASAAVVDAAQDVLIASLRNNVVSASVFTTFSTSVDSRLDSVELVSASAAGALNSVSGAFATTIGNLDNTYATDASVTSVSGAFATTIGNLGSTYATDAELSSVSGAIATRDAGQDSTISTLSSSVASRLGTLETKDITITLTGDVTGTGTITDLGNVSFATTVAANSVALGTDTTGDYVANLGSGTGVTIGSNSGEGSTPTIAVNYGSTSNTAVQGNTALQFGGTSGEITIDSGSSITLGSGGTVTIGLADTITGNRTFSNDIIITGNLTVNGTTTTVNSNTVNIGDNLIVLNSDETGTPSQNAGIEIERGTSTNATLIWDEANDIWEAGLSGSEVPLVTTTASQTLTNKTISGASNTLSNIANASLTNSSITIAGTSTSLGGSITAATILGGTGVISGSAQLPAGTVSGSSQVYSGVSGDITIASNGVATIAANSVALGTDTTGNYMSDVTAGTGVSITHTPGEGSNATIAIGQAVGTTSNVTFGNVTATGTVSGSTFTGLGNLTTYSSSVASRLVTLEGKDITITLTGDVTGTGTITDLGNVSFATTVAANSVALGTDTTGDYVGTITAGSGLSSTGATTGEGIGHTLSIATGGVTNAMLAGSIANDKLTNSSITIAGVSTALGGTISAATIGNAIGAVSSSAQVTASVFGAVSGDVTISSTGVATIAANSVALGTDTTGNYVGTITAGTGVSTTGASTGEGIAHTISIGQAVATSSNVQFNSLGVGMAASATAGRIDATNDIVAFSSSDIRFKENIKPIENPIEKIRKISGNTYDWKEENKIEHGYEGNDVGVIAQEIEAVLPQLVQTRESGYKAVKYDKLVALLIEGIKEQQLQIEKLQLEVEGLKKQKGL